MLQKFESPSNGALDLPELQLDRGRTSENRHHELQLATLVVNLLNRSLEILKRTILDAHSFTNFKFHFRPRSSTLSSLHRTKQILNLGIRQRRRLVRPAEKPENSLNAPNKIPGLFIDHAEIIDVEDADAVTIGRKVTVKRLSDGNESVYEIVGFAQSDPSNGKISDESPVGKALIGSKIGETVTVEAPIGNLEYEILNIE